ncbi:MAG TPA: lysophospholipid acyltransferase family protein [bacterium]|nr:lysophospholipid acyltransferase family protein [bacterium]HNO10291.1 lysophospholipid acyltransferase family protein [bacterium]
MIAKLFRWFFRMKGWTITAPIAPNIKKCVIIGAPHTSNWDFVYGIGALECFNMRVNFLAKKELFRFPLKGMFLRMGGIPVDRSGKNSMVDAMIDVFKAREDLMIIIPAEGTRKRVEKWKSGFYHLALGANVPIVLGFLDYEKKLAGFGPALYMTGDEIGDMAKIRDFYKDKTGKISEFFNIDAVRLSR